MVNYVIIIAVELTPEMSRENEFQPEFFSRENEKNMMYWWKPLTLVEQINGLVSYDIGLHHERVKIQFWRHYVKKRKTFF